MLPPEFESIAKELINRYQSFLENDVAGVEVTDLLSAEEQVVDFVHGLCLKCLIHLCTYARAKRRRIGKPASAVVPRMCTEPRSGRGIRCLGLCWFEIITSGSIAGTPTEIDQTQILLNG